MNRISILKHVFIYFALPFSFIYSAENEVLSQFAQIHDSAIKPFISKYCTDCHGDKKQKAKLRLDTLSSISLDSQNLNTWLEVLEQVDKGEMPPEDELQPTSAELASFKDYILKGTTVARKSMSQPGQSVVMRRLNNEQYKNTLRDLLKIDLSIYNPIRKFPIDQKDEHFRNIGSALVNSSFLLKEQLITAKDIADKILVDLEKPKKNFWECKPPYTQTTTEKKKEGGPYPGMSQANKLMAKVGAGKFHNIYQNVELKKGYMWIHKFREGVPKDGFYKVTFRVQGRNQDYKAPEKLVRHDRREKLLATISVGNEKYGAISLRSPYDKDLETFELESDKWTEIGGVYWIEKGYSPRLSFPSGTNKVKHVKSVMGKKKEYADILYPVPMKKAEKGQQKSGGKNKITTGRKKYQPPGGNNWERFLKAYDDVGPVLRCDNVKIEGPIYKQWPLPSYKNILGTTPIAEADPKQVIFKLAEKAFRGPVTSEDLQSIYALMDSEKEAGADNRTLIRMGISALLISDRFLYFDEQPGQLDAYAIANRLSYFLWSSMPDEELMELAKSGAITRPSVIKEQARRMLKDDKATAFMKGFVNDWLQLNKIGQTRPDPQQAKVYYRELLENHMKNETIHFFAEILNMNKPITDFLDADYTYMNRGLGKFYGYKDYLKLPKNDYKRVKITDPRRGGLLGQMSVLTATANGVDTSPITRGVWVLENLLGVHLPPPPENVAAVEPDVRGATTIRQQLEKHMSVASCTDCHKKIDPAGWALESFDAIGQLREKYVYTLDSDKIKNAKGMEIDTSGIMHTGESYKDIVDFKKVLLQKKDDFMSCFVKKLMTYASGRTMEPLDNAEINRIVSEVKPQGARLQDIVLEVVTSKVFLNK